MNLNVATHDGGDIYTTPRVAQVQGRPRAFPKLFKRWFGVNVTSDTLLGKGTYGRVYTLVFTEAMKQHFRRYSSMMTDRVGFVSDIPVGTTIAVKVSISSLDADKHNYAIMLREMALHNELRHQHSILIDDKEFSIRSQVPTLYFAGVDRDMRASVTMMKVVKGDTLYKYINRCMSEKRPVPASVVARFEHALLSLWLSGYFHLDLHSGNIFYDEESRRMTIIDFGMAVKIPEDLVYSLVQYLRGRVSGVDPKDTVRVFWERQGRRFAERVVYGRHVHYSSSRKYYANITSWKELMQFVNAADPALDDARRRLWIPSPCTQNRLKDMSRRKRERCAKSLFQAFGES
jgi:serine/threonine protein kinase